MIGAAFELALEAHRGQVDKAGQAYIGHVARVCAGVDGATAQVVALLQDVVEDTSVSLEHIRAEFGNEVADAVDCLTRRESETQEAYLARVAANPLARQVKLSDIADNSNPSRLSLLEPNKAKSLKKKYGAAATRLST